MQHSGTHPNTKAAPAGAYARAYDWTYRAWRFS